MAYMYNGEEVPKEDVAKILDLVVKGKTIVDIEKSFKGTYNNAIISKIIFKEGSKSIIGNKATITRKLNKLENAKTKEQRQKIINQVDDLVNTLYENYKLALLEIADYEKIKAIVNK
ncbi:MAG: hypothetical protein GQ570_05630 [Helicobacteraceae bacterium]|nr:hypothetical protein [Helicobacteraceae bacterium]